MRVCLLPDRRADRGTREWSLFERIWDQEGSGYSMRDALPAEGNPRPQPSGADWAGFARRMDDTLRVAVNTNLTENARLAFEHRAKDRIQDLIDTDFEFYKRVNDDEAFARFFIDWLFDRFRRQNAL